MLAEAPENVRYMIAAYVVAPVILGGYLVSLWRRVKRAVGRSGGQAVGRSDSRTAGGGGRQGEPLPR
jgi:hypothetical protein